ncbi:granzyme E-like isoform X3 [Cricetulus griseus]|uniref:Granzyme E-like isoform X3 n=1 Tax=Cricetulus griseus TaxID=10029 RepID=A0A9J7HBE5_CRIGR|nr:granzyme E-like isoform X3 [Cricetulus griseus]XP_035311533.1 granzyme E-like isoform X3 [Cricetulus griseus]
MSPVLILLIFLLQSGAGAEEIIGGHEVKPHSRPYMAFIQFVCDDVDICCCGGFLVRDDFVLTAAHCLGSSMKVTLGAHDVTTQEKTQQIIPVAKAIPHPDYNPKDHSNDIMLLRLERKANRTKAVRTLKLPKVNAQGDSGGPLVCDNRAYGIVSFGNTESISSGIFTKVVPFMQWIKRSMKPI